MKSFTDFSKRWRSNLERAVQMHIIQLCDTILPSTHMPNIWITALRCELTDYAVRGKMIRGLLTAYWADFYRHECVDNDALFSVAAALELLQTFLLIHDDIMDDDLVRRGMPSMHVRLERLVASLHESCVSSSNNKISKTTKPDFCRMGTSLAICAGDIVFSHAVQVLVQSMPSSCAIEAVRVFTSYVSKVGLAQMNDIYSEQRDILLNKDEILAMYEGKTGHYTFTLPALMGYMYAMGRQNEIITPMHIENLDRMGSLMGKLFQIHDDVLDLRQPSSIIGKPRGSDIIRKKRTYLSYQLFRCAGVHNKEDVLQSLWDGEITEYDIKTICDFADEWGVWDAVKNECDTLTQELYTVLDTVIPDEQSREYMKVFIQSLITRSS